MTDTWLRVLLALSLAGVVLLPIFGVVLRVQPQLVHGLHVDPHAAERNCYLAAGCYGLTLLLSAIALYVKKRRTDSAKQTNAAVTASASPTSRHLTPRYSGSSPAVPMPGRRSLTPREKKLIAAALVRKSTRRRASDAAAARASSSIESQASDDAAARARFDAV